MGSAILQPRDILSIIELILWTPILVFAVLVCIRHGFSKQLGWLSMIILPVFRISASATFIAASMNQGNVNLIIASSILQSFGLASIIICIQGLLSRLNESIPECHRIPRRGFRLLHLCTSAAIALAIVAGVEFGDSNPGNDGQALTLQRVAMILFLVILVVLAIANGLMLVHRRNIMSTERPILVATTVAIPLVTPHIVFANLAVWGVATNIFSLINQNKDAVIVTALLTTLPEMLIAVTVIRTGFKVPTLSQYRVQTSMGNNGFPFPGMNRGQVSGTTASKLEAQSP